MSNPVLCALLCIILLVSVSPAVPAAAEDATRAEPEIPLRPGVWSLQFNVSRDYGFDPIRGLVVAARRHFSTRSALRLGLGVSTGLDETTIQTESFTAEMKSDSHDYTLSVDYLFYPTPKPGVSLFLGGGVFAGYSDITRTQTDRVATDIRYESRSEYDTWNLGLTGTLGAEWFAAGNFSLFGQYGLSLSYTDRDIQRGYTHNDISPPGTNQNSESSEERVIQITANRISLGIVMYF